MKQSDYLEDAIELLEKAASTLHASTCIEKGYNISIEICLESIEKKTVILKEVQELIAFREKLNITI